MRPVLVQHFIESLAEECEELRVPDNIEEELPGIVAGARLRWPNLALDQEVYSRYLARQLARAKKGQGLESMCTEDLYIACACLQNDNAIALREFEDTFFPGAGAACRRLDSTGSLVDEMYQSLRLKLFVPAHEGEEARIGAYLGHGSLQRWLRAVALRICLDLLRSQKACPKVADEGILEILPDETQDPELAHLRKHYGEQLKSSMAQAIAALPGKERLLLRYHYDDRLSIEKIGEVFGVHKTTAFRRLESIRARLVDETREAMRTMLGVDQEELASIMRLIPSQLELSMARLLRTKNSQKESS